jgi:two-component system chemotaxis response regulator CheB
LSEKRILLVEQDQILAGQLEKHLDGYGSECAVLSVRSVDEALQVLRRNDVDLVVAEHSGSGTERIDGIALLRSIRAADLPVRTILSVAEHLEGDRIAALALGCSSFLVRPYPEEKFADLVFNMLCSIQGFTGRLVGMKLEDVIQMFCYRKDSTLLTVSHNGETGTIYVEDGGIVHAECDSLLGVDAFYEILGWESGEFLSQVILSVPMRTVFMEWQSLLMEGIRQRDEIRHALEGPLEPRPLHIPVALSSESRSAEPGNHGDQPKRVMIVDDSRFIRKIVQEIVESDCNLRVVGYATNGQEALAKIDELKPDLILLDWDMPIMKGSTTLMHIMIRSPCPVVVLSGFTGGVGANPFDLLCLGGVDFLRKPQNNWRIDGKADDLVRRIKAASEIHFERIRRVKIPAVVAHVPEVEARRPSRTVSVIVSSTGGSIDLIRIVPLLQHDLPSGIIVLHDMQGQAIASFIDYLDKRSRIAVQSLVSGESILEGVCYVHPASVPLELVRNGETICAKILFDMPGQTVIDHFLISAAKVMGRHLVALILSGGSTGGSLGLKAVKRMEGVTVAQDPTTSVDPRMAQAALNEGAVDYTCAADNVAQTFQNLIRQVASKI